MVHLVVIVLKVGLVTIIICRHQAWFSLIKGSRADSCVKTWRVSSFTNRKLDCAHHLRKFLQLQIYLLVLHLCQCYCARKNFSREVKINCSISWFLTAITMPKSTTWLPFHMQFHLLLLLSYHISSVLETTLITFWHVFPKHHNRMNSNDVIFLLLLSPTVV
jgi:hypothetical protein